MKLHYIKTNIGHFYKRLDNSYPYYFSGLWFNGNPYHEGMLQNGHLKLSEPLTSVYKHIKTLGEVIGYKLKNPDLASMMIPAKLSLQDVQGDYCDGPGDYWTNTKYQDLRNLYEEDRADPKDEMQAVEFEIVSTQEFQVEGLGKPEVMKVSMAEGNYNKSSLPQSLESILCYSDIEKLLTPEPLLWTRPCSLTPKQVYGIIRKHVQENLDRKVAKITSDYDFCFTVKRIVDVKPYTIRVDESRTKKPKYVNRTIETKDVQVFEMTWPGAESGMKGYRDYTCIEGWPENNLREMQEQIKDYLEDLMYNLNMPLKECECCAGTGHIQKVINVKDRG
jgi:hypothetical protein